MFALISTSRASGQGSMETVLFKDDFESGKANAWQLMGTDGRSGKDFWQVEQEPDGNWVLSGTEHTWGILVKQGSWSDFTFKARVKLEPGNKQGLHLNFRLGRCERYFIAFHPNQVSLSKTMPCDNHPNLISSPGNHEFGRWYMVEIVGKGNRIQVYVDGVLRIDHTDSTPVLAGSIGIETLDGSHVHIDDVTVIGPAPTPTPTPLPGLAWTFTGGPRGGIGYDIRIHPLDSNFLWVTDANAGVHRSADGGLTWIAMNSGISARAGFSGDAVPIFSLTIDQNNPNILWAGTQGMRGVFKSVDGGKAWSQMDNGIEDRPVMEIRAFTVDPKDSNIVYMGGNYRPDPRKLEERGFIYKTTDGGKQWTKILEPGALVRWIIVDPTNTNILYASTGIFDRIAVQPEGILKSTDGGRTWFPINEGLTSLSVGGLAMHPQNPQILFATTGKASAFLNEQRELYGAVFKTTDGGQHWRKVYPIGRDNQIRYSAVAFAPSNPNIVYVDAGNEFLRSADSGETWQRFDTAPKGENRGQPIALAVHPKNPNLVYMNAYDGGVFRSDDGGKAWADASVGYTGAQAWDIAVAPSNPNYVVVGSKNGVHVSLDGGLSWQGRSTTGYINNMRAVAIDPTAPVRILTGHEIDGNIRMSTDGGQKWQEALPPVGVDTPTQRIAMNQIAFAPSQPSIVYAASGIQSMTIQNARETKGGGVFKSTNGGRSWLPVNQGLEPVRLNMLALAVHPRDPNIVYVGTLDGGVFKTTDGGGTWSKSTQGIPVPEIRALAIDPSNPEVVYAGSENAALFKSVDGGKNWQQSSAGMNPESAIHSIVIDPSGSQVVYAADMRSGVYRSADSGKTWVLINQGLRVRAVNRLAISSDGKLLFAATEGGGVFRIGQPQIAATPTPTVASTTTPSLTAPPPTRAPTPAPSPTTIAMVAQTPTPAETKDGSGLCSLGFVFVAFPFIALWLAQAWLRR
ncbi:MAG: DUF1080 domain-containing protein [Chloroflexi bacterium]|nr:DUF1080 domain-containing protein [Chloroflexota bacterium]